MTEHIISMVRIGNPEAVEKYVKNHLPNDQPSLERIYKELLEYNNKAQPSRNLQVQKRSHSLKNLNKKESKSSDSQKFKKQETSQMKRSENIIRILKEKGFKASNDSEEIGMQMFENQRKKLVKPLITNSKLLKSEEAQIDRQIHRYQINGVYYKDLLENDRQKEFIDPEMSKFFERRNSVMESLRGKPHQNICTNHQYDHVAKRLYEQQSQRVSFQKMPSVLKESKYQTARKSSTQSLLNVCNEQVKSQKFKTIKPSMNYFQALQHKLNQLDRKDQGELDYNQMASLMAKRLIQEQNQRYTNSYMSMLTDKAKAGSRCKLNAYHKDLIRDEKKMRKIIDFHSK